MSFRKKQLRKYGKGFGKKKNWRKGLLVTGQGAQLLGQAAVLGGAATGQPELVAAGGALAGGGKLAEGVGKSHLLKSKKEQKKL